MRSLVRTDYSQWVYPGPDPPQVLRISSNGLRKRLGYFGQGFQGQGPPEPGDSKASFLSATPHEVPNTDVTTAIAGIGYELSGFLGGSQTT